MYIFNLESEKPQPKKKKIDDNHEDNENNDDEYVWLDTNEPEKDLLVNKGEPISVAKLYAKRENTIQSYKQRIGLLASTLLENPELKVCYCFIHIYEVCLKNKKTKFTVYYLNRMLSK